MALIQAGIDARPEVGTQAATAKLPAVATFVIGLALVFSVGFMHATVVHNGAHDTRHANGFPCH
jgi:cobalt transporter subunit CbtB